MWTDIEQSISSIITLLNKNEMLIEAFTAVLSTTALLICQWHINKNVIAQMKIEDYFSEIEQQQK